MSRTVQLTVPHLESQEQQALVDVLQSGWITMGELVQQFEAEFSRQHDIKFGIGVNSCTAALHIALASTGITTGDEVLVPSLTFAATANAALYCGAKPVFVDIESESLPLISLQDAKNKLTSRTKAVIVMHYGGYCVDMKAWQKFAKENNLLLIEDAAHAPLGKDVGKYSDAPAFSFYSNKNMTTAEGGMMLTNNQAIERKARLLRSHGMTHSTLSRDKGHVFSYDIKELGYNYRMDELRAALGLVQLKQLPKWNNERRQLVAMYRQTFDSSSGISVPFSSDHDTVGHIMPVLLPEEMDRISVMADLRKKGIQSSIHYPPIHLFEYHRKILGAISLPRTESYSARELTLPLYPALTKDDIDYVVNTLTSSVKIRRTD